MIRTEIDSMPAELDEITRRVMQLEIEEAALKKEKDKASHARLEELRKELADLKEQADTMRAQWEEEKQAIHKVIGPEGRDRADQAPDREGRARVRPQQGCRAPSRQAPPAGEKARGSGAGIPEGERSW